MNEPLHESHEQERAERTRSAQAEVDAWNDAHPVGTSVRYWTGLREGRGKPSTTRTEASVLGGHTAVVWVVGEPACIALTHIETIPESSEQEPVPAEDRAQTDEERRAIATLHRLSKRWPKSLMLFSWSGSLVVVDREQWHAATDVDRGHGRCVMARIDIPNDGGDPND